MLQVALEAAKAYNREKPPHQTVGDTVMMALQYAAMQARKQRESGEYVTICPNDSLPLIASVSVDIVHADQLGLLHNFNTKNIVCVGP